jgi:D-arabinose 1-dehydrogenase-like Zn-dependent alcohol dehydrogenase
MKAAVVPQANAKWEIREVPTLEPSAGQVLVRIRASGICFTDVWTTQGTIHS